MCNQDAGKKLCTNANTMDTNGLHHMKQQNIQMDLYELTGLSWNVRIYIYIYIFQISKLRYDIMRLNSLQMHIYYFVKGQVLKCFCTHRYVQKLNPKNISTMNKATKLLWSESNTSLADLHTCMRESLSEKPSCQFLVN